MTIRTVHTKEKTKQRKADPKFAYGRIITCNGISKSSSASIEYDFTVDGKTYENGKVYYNFRKNECFEFTWGSGTFLIAYEDGHPENNEILVTQEDYNAYNLRFPDTLAWVYKYFYE